MQNSICKGKHFNAQYTRRFKIIYLKINILLKVVSKSYLSIDLNPINNIFYDINSTAPLDQNLVCDLWQGIYFVGA